VSLMTVRLKIALTIFLTGLLTCIGVVATVLYAFERFEHESTYYRASAFLERVVQKHTDIFAMQERFQSDFNGFLANLVLFEPDTQLYLLDANGTVVASSSDVALPPGFKVAMGPVMEAANPMPMPYVLGDDPENMGGPTVVAARAVRRSLIRQQPSADGYLYVVSRKQGLQQDNLAAIQGSLSRPTLVLILTVVGLTTLLAAWVTAAVTRPLKQLTDSVAKVTRNGLEDWATTANANDSPALNGGAVAARDEIGQLTSGIRTMLNTVHSQWSMLRRLDHFRREGVSNLSHDLRSPLTATAACLETLEARWAGEELRRDDRQLVEVALRNTRNAARMVQSLGDLAQLDEPEFKLRTEVMDLAELLDDVVLRFAERATRQSVHLDANPAQSLAAAKSSGGVTFTTVDVELIERALANLVDNALKFCRPGDTICLEVQPMGSRVQVSVTDTGPGIAAADLPHLFDRFYQSRQSTAPATGEGGKGLGLAIVKRIVEMHGGQVQVSQTPNGGTCVTMDLPTYVPGPPLKSL
jgi:signal transduction histidine kinase